MCTGAKSRPAAPARHHRADNPPCNSQDQDDVAGVRKLWHKCTHIIARSGERQSALKQSPWLIVVLCFGLSVGRVPAAFADHHNFDEWRDALRAEALARGTRAETFDTAFDGVEPIPRVIELDRRQPEFTMTFDQYIFPGSSMRSE